VVVDGLLARGAVVQVHDPEAIVTARRAFGDRVAYGGNNYEALAGADALVILTEWKQYRTPDFDRMRALLKEPVIVDGRNVFEPARMARLGFDYVGVGRPRARPDPADTVAGA
jgi:UDPglucose 6-dehydrogenase